VACRGQYVLTSPVSTNPGQRLYETSTEDSGLGGAAFELSLKGELHPAGYKHTGTVNEHNTF